MGQPPFGIWPPPTPGGTTSSDFVTNDSTIPGLTVTAALNALAFKPERTLFVAQSWPNGGADPAVFFTDPSAALSHAATLTPTPTNPVTIILFPGTYSQNLTLISNVHLFAASGGVTLTGNVAYHPGVGGNASQLHLNERVVIENLTFQTGTFVYDATGKSDLTKSSVLYLLNCTTLGPTLAASGRAASGGSDLLTITNQIDGGTTWTLNGIFPTWTACQFSAQMDMTDLVFGGVFTSTVFFGPVNLVNSPFVGGDSNTYISAVNIDAASSLLFNSGSNFSAPVTVAAGGQADLRMCEYGSLSNLAGAGAIDRSIWRTTAEATSIGANVITLSPPYIDGNYNVTLTLTAAGASGAFVSGKAANQFVLNDPVGGNSFDITILKE